MSNEAHEASSQANTTDDLYGTPAQEESKAEQSEEAKAGEEKTQEEESKSEQQPEDQKAEESEESASDESKESKEETQEEEFELERSEDSPLSKEQFEDVAALVKEHNLSKEQAEGVLQAHENFLNNFAEHQAALVEKQRDDWFDECKADPEIGGENFTSAAEKGKRALDAFGSDKLREELKATGYGNHPEVVRMLAKIGDLVDSDKLILGSKGNGQVSHAEALYGNN